MPEMELEKPETTGWFRNREAEESGIRDQMERQGREREIKWIELRPCLGGHDSIRARYQILERGDKH